MQSEKLRELIQQLIRQELAEMSTSAAVAPYATPNAFRPKKKKKKDDDELKLSAGMSVVKEGYYEWKKDETLSTKQKLAKSMTEIRNRITEIEKIVKHNVKLKNETAFKSNQYYKRTKGALHKISEKLMRLSTRVKDLV